MPRTPRIASHQGFTLVELLVVIGIIALLVSMLLPALNKARSASKITVCASNQRQIYLGVSMYANDNRGNLPGTNAWQRARGADVLQDHGAYPWEFDERQDYWYEKAILPPDATFGQDGTARWFGIGQLVHLKYLSPSAVMSCPDFVMGEGANFAENESWTFTDAFYEYEGDARQIFDNTGKFRTSYVLNTVPYYARHPSNKANGKLGRPGRMGGDFQSIWAVPHQRALIMCLLSYNNSNDHPRSSAHQDKGVNVTYIDGHVVWQPIDESTKALLNLNWLNSSDDDLCGYWYSFWCWATKVE